MATRAFGALIAVAVVAVFTASAGASNFGGHYLNSGCCSMYGSRADIGLPCCDFTPSLATFALMRVSSESADESALIQIGFGQTAGQALGNCGFASSLTNYYEWFTGGGVNEHCLWMNAPGYGTRHLYSTFRSTTTPSTTTWKAGIDSTTKVTADLGVDRRAYRFRR